MVLVKLTDRTVVIKRPETDEERKAEIRVRTERESGKIHIETRGQWGDTGLWFPEQFGVEVAAALQNVLGFLLDEETREKNDE